MSCDGHQARYDGGRRRTHQGGEKTVRPASPLADVPERHLRRVVDQVGEETGLQFGSNVYGRPISARRGLNGHGKVASVGSSVGAETFRKATVRRGVHHGAMTGRRGRMGIGAGARFWARG